MIRFVTDIKGDAWAVFIRKAVREKLAMRRFFISLSVAWVVWMSTAAALAIYSREFAEFVVEHFP